jgi:N-formylglutamate amidohydrolase
MLPKMIFTRLAGASESPVILHVPHASRAITPTAGLTLDAEALTRELDHLTDAHTDHIARQAASTAAVRPWIFENRWSRLVVDPERFPGEAEEMAEVGMAAVYTHGYAGARLRDDDPVRDEALLAAHYRPYADAMTDLVTDRLSVTGRAVIVDVHSYPSAALPYELHSAGPRPEICLGTSAFHTPQWLLDAASAAFAGYATGLDSPFAGCYVPLRYYETHRDVSALMVEIRRDTYMTEPGGPPTDGLIRVAGALATLIDAVPL